MTRSLLLSIILLAGCQAAEQADDAHEMMPEIPGLDAQAAATTWNANWAAGNAEGIGAAYADDAIIYPPNGDPIQGREAITEFWGGVLATSVVGTIESVEAHSEGTFAYETGNYVIDDSAGTHLDHGEWKMMRDMWNSNMPVPEM